MKVNDCYKTGDGIFKIISLTSPIGGKFVKVESVQIRRIGGTGVSIITNLIPIDHVEKGTPISLEKYNKIRNIVAKATEQTKELMKCC